MDPHRFNEHRSTEEEVNLAMDILQRMTDAAGNGVHSVTIALGDLVTNTRCLCRFEFMNQGESITFDKLQAARFSFILSAAVSGKFASGMVLRTFGEGNAHDSVRAWNFMDGDPLPMTGAETFNSYCENASTGKLVGPAPGVEYEDAPVIHI
ncbi:hypothetical protein ACWCWD_29635 [Streptomyces sp. NPDC001493]